MPTTYQITEAQSRLSYLTETLLQAEDDAERDAIQQEIDALLDGLGDAEEEKLDSLRAVALRLDTLEREARDEARRLGERARAFAGQVERIKGMASLILDGRRRRMGDRYKVATAQASYRLQLSPPSVQGPEDPWAWLRLGWAQEQPPKPDKTAAKKALQAMAPEEWPAGWTLEQSESIRW